MERLNVKFVCKTYTSAGYTLDASMLGAEYAPVFHDCGGTPDNADEREDDDMLCPAAYTPMTFGCPEGESPQGSGLLLSANLR